MKVRSGTSLWRALNPQFVQAPKLSHDAQCEALVIGSGVSGALIADCFAREGVDVILIDKRQPATGSTAASTGLLQYEIDTHLSELVDAVGTEKAVHAYRRGLTAIDQIEERCRELHDCCGFVRRKSLYFAHDDKDRAELEREFELRRQFGFEVEFLEREALAAISSIDAACAIVSTGDAEIDPYRYTQRLLDHARSKGVRVFGETNVQEIEQHADSITAVTPEGQLRARRVVFATGYESEKYLGKKVGSLHSTYAVASEPLESTQGWPNQCLLWETSRPYFYARQTPDGRALIGGEDTDYSNDHQRDELVDRQVDRLIARFKQLFPHIPFEAAYSWAGTFGETEDGLAYIGHTEEHPLAYFAIGYGGNGITFSMIAAKLIVDLYFGRPNPDAEVFGFDR